ncbi:MAG: D-tyrosyl-tRNA(Tyr) deacylase [Clostridia bacterium]|nr:D-tyrosyl-tRNA(Tyr) deacylase [Clostridia bacterium]
MRITIQRVKKASVKVDEKIVGEIEKGFLVFLGVTHSDTEENIDYLVKKLCNLRVFEDENEKMNLSIKDIDGELLIVSQFTLYADTKHGNRPSFTESAKPDYANKLYELFIEKCKKCEIKKVEHGIFGANMEVSLINDGPVTINMEN